VRYAQQLKRDIVDLRAHLDQLTEQYPNVAERIREFKRDLAKKIELPTHTVEPLTAYSRGRVLGIKEEYYQVGNCVVIREGSQMRIIGIRFFTRLF
jgi:CRISPR/Cas system CSM-associated protein Csm2 small subunit